MQTTATMTGDDRQQAFAALLQRHAGIVFKVANTYARLPDDRADLAKEIAAQLWRAWPKYDPARSASTWMYRVALNVAISHVRELDRLRADGHSVRLDRRHWLIEPNAAALRHTQLFRTLLHEIGHHVDYRQTLASGMPWRTQAAFSRWRVR